jgi:DNA invertase Pin-like site-specific DNA recombinase
LKRLNNRKNRETTALLYVRLSRDDNLEGESYSIGNQKKLLTKAAKDKGHSTLLTFADDGIQSLLAQNFVKDLRENFS